MPSQMEAQSVENRELPLKATRTNMPQPPPPKPAAAAAEVADAVEAATVVPPDRQDAEGRLAVVVNCHLTGGPAPERRMRQVFDALDTVRKETAKVMNYPQSAAGGIEAEGSIADSQVGGKKTSGAGSKRSGKAGSDASKVPVIVCGDMNSDGRTAVWELLRNGVVAASFREEGYPEVRVRFVQLQGEVSRDTVGGNWEASVRVLGGESWSLSDHVGLFICLLVLRKSAIES